MIKKSSIFYIFASLTQRKGKKKSRSKNLSDLYIVKTFNFRL